MSIHHRLAELEPGCSLPQALELFDACAPVASAQLTGLWKGSGMPTGHPMDGLLEATGWYGKRFCGDDDVDPLVFRHWGGGLVRVNPTLMPMSAPQQLFDLTRREPVSKIVRPIVASLRTFSPAARLRQVEYRGQVSATMIYDGLPIFDHFRAVDEDTVIGAMDHRASPQPFMFVLRRARADEQEHIR